MRLADLPVRWIVYAVIVVALVYGGVRYVASSSHQADTYVQCVRDSSSYEKCG